VLSRQLSWLLLVGLRLNGVDSPQATYSRPSIPRDQSRGSDFAAHVGDQRILKCPLQHSNLVGVQLDVTNLAYSLRQLVGYESCQGSCPLLLYGDDSLRHVVPPVHQTSLKNTGAEYIPNRGAPFNFFSVIIADLLGQPWEPGRRG
jgi:hypothetical protein